MTTPSNQSTIGVLASGGLDSCILVAHLLEQGQDVRPFYVRGGLVWEQAELSALRAFLGALAAENSACISHQAGKMDDRVPLLRRNSADYNQLPGTACKQAAARRGEKRRVQELVVLDLPLGDLYGGGHWSINGRDVPDAQSPPSAVYLPGRNALLAIKPAIWCAMGGIDQLALATLAGNPFADAADQFFGDFQRAVEKATGSRLKILRPFARLEKKDVLQLGRGLPLELTFSCLAPIGGLHCGRCNKCAERLQAFHCLGIDDLTRYASHVHSHP